MAKALWYNRREGRRLPPHINLSAKKQNRKEKDKVRILAIGDVTSNGGIELLEKKLWSKRKELAIDLCIVNAENASFITGASSEQAERLFAAGADVLTGGNHTMRNKAVWSYLDDNTAMLRPINFGDTAPGSGYHIIDCLGYKVMVINAMGTVYMDPVLDSPYGYIDRLLAREKGHYDLAVLDFHAEATGEKVAMGYAYDGAISVIFGTHTHVPTADVRILPKGTGYVTDIGMCGESGGVLGMDPSLVVEKMRSHLPSKFASAKGAATADGVVFDLDPSSGRVKKIQRIMME